MGLPSELLPYAENIYRRFPEEFIALGMPGLEEIFDLRPHGTWSRRLFETPAEKTIEITLRRRAPLLPQLPSPMGASLFGGASLSSLPAFSGLASPQQTAIDAQQQMQLQLQQQQQQQQQLLLLQQPQQQPNLQDILASLGLGQALPQLQQTAPSAAPMQTQFDPLMVAQGQPALMGSLEQSMPAFDPAAPGQPGDVWPDPGQQLQQPQPQAMPSLGDAFGLDLSAAWQQQQPAPEPLPQPAPQLADATQLAQAQLAQQLQQYMQQPQYAQQPQAAPPAQYM